MGPDGARRVEAAPPAGGPGSLPTAEVRASPETGGAVAPCDRRLGVHLSLGSGLLRAADRAEALDLGALQLFTDNPTAWRRRTSPPRDLEAFRRRLAALDIEPVVVHAPYLLNLASPDPVIWERSVGVLAHELRVAPTFGASAIVLHLGSHLGSGAAAGIARIGQGLARALGEAAGDDPPPPPIRVLVENSAGSGDAIGGSMAEVAAVLRAIEDAGVPPSQIGVCLDTAHAWSAGYAIDRAVGVEGLLAEIEAMIGLRRLAVVHLNDSRAELGSRVDRHEHIGAGRIGPEGLRRVLLHPALALTAYILETPGMDDGWDAVNLARARAIASGRDLEPLPPEAFSPRGRDSGRSGPPDEGEGVA